MFLKACVEERLVLYDRAADRTAKLIAHQVILHAPSIGEPVLRSQRLNAVVLEQRTVPLVCTALKHSVSHKSTDLAVLGAKVVSDDAILFNRVRRNRGIRSAAAAGPAADGNAALPLLVVIDAVHHVVAAAGTDAVDCRAAERTTSLLLGNRASDQIDEVVRVPCLNRHVLPHAPINQLREGGTFRFDDLRGSFHRYLLGRRTNFDLHVT